MKPYLTALIISAAFLTGCCPKFQESVTTTTKTDTFIDTVFVDVPVIIAPAESKVIDIDLKSLCDSLYRGQLKPQVRTSEIRRSDGKRQIIATTEIDSLLHLIITCKEDEYKDTLEDVRVQNTLLRTEIENKTKVVVQERWFENSWFYIAVILGLLHVIRTKFK
jgi:hypothetical protein